MKLYLKLVITTITALTIGIPSAPVRAEIEPEAANIIRTIDRPATVRDIINDRQSSQNNQRQPLQLKWTTFDRHAPTIYQIQPLDCFGNLTKPRRN
jgi:hypothetical protein